MPMLPAQAMDPPQPEEVTALPRRCPGLAHSPSLLITAGSLLHAHTLPSNVSISKGRTCRSPEAPRWPAAIAISLQSPFDALQPSPRVQSMHEKLQLPPSATEEKESGGRMGTSLG